jgi:hypothetical protein
MSAAAKAMLATLSRTPGAGREAGRMEPSGIDAVIEMLRCMRSSLKWLRGTVLPIR